MRWSWPGLNLLSMPVGNQVVCWVWSLLDTWKAVIHNSNTFKDVCERNQPLHESKTYDSNSRKWEKQGKNYHSTLGKYNVLHWVIVDIPRSSALGEREIPAQSGRWRQSAQLVNEIDKQIICLGGGGGGRGVIVGGENYMVNPGNGLVGKFVWGLQPLQNVHI